MTYKTDDSSTIETLTKLASELERKLLQIPIYREYQAVRKTLAELSGGPVKVSLEKPDSAEIPYRPVTVRLGRLTSIGAATKALREAGRPMTIHELVEAVQRYGFEFTGSAKSPASALAVYLSKPKERSPIVSIWIDNKPYWWFRDQPVPGAKSA
jgi:HB1, ASXL, restriction endonuclease HTH domain